jgi:hypothetical protein
MLHFILTRLCGLTRRVYFTSTPDRAWAIYFSADGRPRLTRMLR